MNGVYISLIDYCFLNQLNSYYYITDNQIWYTESIQYILWISHMQSWCMPWLVFNVNLTQSRVMWKEGISIEALPKSDWYMALDVINSLDWWLTWGGPSPGMWQHPQAGALGLHKTVSWTWVSKWAREQGSSRPSDGVPFLTSLNDELWSVSQITNP